MLSLPILLGLASAWIAAESWHYQRQTTEIGLQRYREAADLPPPPTRTPEQERRAQELHKAVLREAGLAFECLESDSQLRQRFKEVIRVALIRAGFDGDTSEIVADGFVTERETFLSMFQYSGDGEAREDLEMLGGIKDLCVSEIVNPLRRAGLDEAAAQAAERAGDVVNRAAGSLGRGLPEPLKEWRSPLPERKPRRNEEEAALTSERRQS